MFECGIFAFIITIICIKDWWSYNVKMKDYHEFINEQWLMHRVAELNKSFCEMTWILGKINRSICFLWLNCSFPRFTYIRKYWGEHETQKIGWKSHKDVITSIVSPLHLNLKRKLQTLIAQFSNYALCSFFYHHLQCTIVSETAKPFLLQPRRKNKKFVIYSRNEGYRFIEKCHTEGGSWKFSLDLWRLLLLWEAAPGPPVPLDFFSSLALLNITVNPSADAGLFTSHSPNFGKGGPLSCCWTRYHSNDHICYWMKI